MSSQDGVNMSEDMVMNKEIVKLATQYAGCDRRSAEINEERATIRENAEKLGIPSKSFQDEVARLKKMTLGERQDYDNGIARMREAFAAEGSEAEMRAELYPEIVEAEKRRAQREADRKAKKAAEQGRPAEELDAKTDTDPRSDPEAGGAEPKAGKGKKANGGPSPTPAEVLRESSIESDQALKDSIAAVEAREQQEGAEVLKDGLPMSQSAQAAAKREEARVK